MSKKFLVVWEDNWADEMDLASIEIIDEKTKDDLDSAIEAIIQDKVGEYTICVGSNECIDYENGKQLKKHLRIRELKENELEVLKSLKLLKINNFGIVDQIIEYSNN